MIVFNGQTYASPDEMPADVRKMYEETLKILSDKNGDGEPDLFNTPFLGNMLRDAFADLDADGIPDIMQGQFTATTGAVVSGSTVIVYEGKTYNNIDDLPPDAQKEIRQKMADIDLNRSSIPETLEQDISATPSFQTGLLTGDQDATTTQAGGYSSTPQGLPDIHEDNPPPIETRQLESRSLISLPLILFLVILCLAVMLYAIYWLLQV
jgi:hypothetical protein